MKFPQFRVMNLFNIVLLVLALIQFYLLGPLNKWSEGPMKTLVESIDYSFKLIPGFIIPYYSIFLMLLLLMFLIIRKKEAGDMSVFLLAALMLWSLVNLGHGFFNTQVMVRPEIKSDGFFFEAVKSLYASVQPYNTLPNWHVATGLLCVIAYFKLGFGKKYAFLFWGLLVILSPLFVKMTHFIDVMVAAPLPFICYALSEKIANVKIRTETIQEVTKVFTVESLVQSVAIGIRDESTLVSLIEGLERIEKNLSDEDRKEIAEVTSKMNPNPGTLKDMINKLIRAIDVEAHLEKAREMSGSSDKNYSPSDKELKRAIEELVNTACMPFDDAKFRHVLLNLKKKNTEKMNMSAMEEAAADRSNDIVYRFKSFIESHKKDMPIIKALSGNNGHHKLNFDDIKDMSRELRKPPYEISPDEIWNAFMRIDSARVKPLGDKKSPSNIISLTKFALGNSEILEPFADSVERKFRNWIEEENTKSGKTYTEEEMEWLKMMKDYVASFLEIEMLSFNQPPFVSKGGAARAYNIFGPDLNRIMYEFNEKLI
jgi:hypothetical protein